MKKHLNKQLQSQKKNLESLENFKKLQTKRRKLIARSLRTVNASNNRIIFDDTQKNEQRKTFENKVNNFNDERFKIDERFFSESSESEIEESQSNEVLNKDEETKDDSDSKMFTTFYETDSKFIQELKDKNSKTSQNNDFSFLSLMGREPIKNSEPTVTSLTKPKNDFNKKEKILIHKSPVNLCEGLLDTLKSGIISDKDKLNPIFNIDFNEIQSITSSFRQHNLDHLQKNWKIHRKGFIKRYKKLRKLALIELKKKKLNNDKK